MENFITITLDTTPPTLEIFIPNYATKETTTEVIIEANEKLANWQDIYIVDSENKIYKQTFTYDDTRFVGEVSFNQMSLGIATIYVRVMDLVHNKSSLVSKSVSIIESNPLNVVTSERVREIVTNARIRTIQRNNRTASVVVTKRIREVDVVIHDLDK